MSNKTYSLTVAVMFSLIAVLHLLRILLGWDAAVGGWEVPMWFSWLAVIWAGYLSYQGCKISRQ